jgi:hypothetical protein
VKNRIGADDTGGAVTVTDRVVWFEPPAFVAVSLAVYAPAAAYVCVGFRSVEVPPSPKLHCQLVGLPVDVSVNVTAAFVCGEPGLNVNAAVGGTGGPNDPPRTTNVLNAGPVGEGAA